MQWPIVQPTYSEEPAAPLWSAPAAAEAAAPSCLDMLGGAARKCLVASAACTGVQGGRTGRGRGFFDGVVDESVDYIAGSRDRFIVETMPTLKQLERAEREFSNFMKVNEHFRADPHFSFARVIPNSFRHLDEKEAKDYVAGCMLEKLLPITPENKEQVLTVGNFTKVLGDVKEMHRERDNKSGYAEFDIKHEDIMLRGPQPVIFDYGDMFGFEGGKLSRRAMACWTAERSGPKHHKRRLGTALLLGLLFFLSPLSCVVFVAN